MISGKRFLLAARPFRIDVSRSEKSKQGPTRHSESCFDGNGYVVKGTKRAASGSSGRLL
jgi:hypothetical protein